MQNPTDQAEATVPEETVSDDSPNWNRSVVVRRKAAKRTNPFELTAEELHLMSSSSLAEDLPARKKLRLEEPLPTTTDEAARKTASHDVAVGLPPATADNDNDTVNTDPMVDTQPNAGATRATGHWTSEEDAKLTSAVSNTLSRWNDALIPNMNLATGSTGKLTAEEDNELKDAVLTHGGKMPRRWTLQEDAELASAVSNSLSRWNDTLIPNVKLVNVKLVTGRTGRWTADEDKKLKDAVLTHGGKKWGAIVALVPGRTKAQCYGRWRDILNPGIALEAGRTGKWLEDEVTKLKDAVLTHGSKNWKKIAALVPGRTNIQCRKKWSGV
jgi:hypothetical protein